MINRTFARQVAINNANFAFEQFQDYGTPGMTDAERLEYAIDSCLQNAFDTLEDNGALRVSKARLHQCCDELQRAFDKRAAELRAAL